MKSKLELNGTIIKVMSFTRYNQKQKPINRDLKTIQKGSKNSCMSQRHNLYEQIKDCAKQSEDLRKHGVANYYLRNGNKK